MKLSFKRITSSGGFIPEIDGLRFIAIASVILVHLSSYLTIKDIHQYKDVIDYTFLKRILSHGSLGVPLFFVISGFILGLPFAKFYLLKEKPVNIKNYFFRRLTRLEPPYILAMTLLLFSVLYVSNTLTISEGITSYFSSIFYLHNFIYPGILPKINGVTWSLEIEVQFYILAPLMAYIFSVKQPNVRRIAIISMALIFLTLSYLLHTPFISLLNYVHYFFIGFLLADLYVTNANILPKSTFDSLIAFLFFCIIWVYEKREFKTGLQMFSWELVQLISIFFLYYYVLFHKVFKLLSFKLITNIGGMCYSIYLLHLPIISAFGKPILRFSFSQYSLINTMIYSILLISAILMVSSVFFLLVERPCMDKNWYKKIFRKQSPKGLPDVLPDM